MPVITIELGKATKEQKAELVKEFVTKASEILKIPEQSFVTLIKENDYDNLGKGTQLLSEIRSK
ncbi:4-oxalocrotonate tautomerase DmpI [Petroclostridium sp. X23]|uniref:4-oxalocrotonate tautomerase DmpI n=1 Tax=Petroclostridium sp. X23 TaxID=3045146 RepID=UPI0024AE17C1|nr:4-oxalocrotonate tautomerase DmpI [Petroclostridium sp. X23]WHH58504.1 tautomerase family protein [Petroclostridium sp. X23]